MAFLVPVDRTGAVPLGETRSHCLLLGDHPMPAALREVTGAGASLETTARPAIGTRVAIRHAQAGTIAGDVAAHTSTGLRLAFDGSETAIGFALAVIAARLGAGG